MIAALREMNFLHAARARAWLRVLALGLALWAAVFLVARHGWVDRSGDVSAADFSEYWSAATLARAGHAARVYDVQTLSPVEHEAVPINKGGYFAFYYPPSYLLLCMPMAFVSYLAALLGFSAVGLAAYLIVMRAYLPGPGRWMAILAYPGLLVTLLCGQNSLFSVACIGGYGLLLQRRPYLAGACLGMLACKPQLALAAPVLLLCARRPAPIIGAATSFAALFLLSGALLGFDAWQSFFAHLAEASRVTSAHVMNQSKLVSINEALRLVGLGARPALAAQVAFALLGMAAAGYAGWHRVGGPGEAAMLSAVCLIISPHVGDYDLTVLSVAMAFMLNSGVRKRFMPWEKLTLLITYMLPVLGTGIAQRTGVQISPMVVLTLALLTWRRLSASPAAS